MIGDWSIQALPLCTHHVFLSHCAEDRDRLVKPVHRELENAGFAPWLDVHEYPRGQSAFEAIREGIIRCRHIIHFVTGPFLAQGRGWNSVEVAYAQLLQETLRVPALELCHIHMPLYFVPRANLALRRSAWGVLAERGRHYQPGRVDSNASAWAVREILAFIRQEERRGLSIAEQIQNDPAFRPRLEVEPNLLRRVMCADPPPSV